MELFQISFSEYMQQALVETMRFDIEEGNFSDALLEKIGSEDSKSDNSSPSCPTRPDIPDLIKSDLDLRSCSKAGNEYGVIDANMRYILKCVKSCQNIIL
jgi:hypothetical protein